MKLLEKKERTSHEQIIRNIINRMPVSRRSSDGERILHHSNSTWDLVLRVHPVGGNRGRSVVEMTTITWVRDCKTLGQTKVRNDDSRYVRKALLNQLANNWKGFGQGGDRIIISIGGGNIL